MIEDGFMSLVLNEDALFTMNEGNRWKRRKKEELMVREEEWKKRTRRVVLRKFRDFCIIWPHVSSLSFPLSLFPSISLPHQVQRGWLEIGKINKDYCHFFSSFHFRLISLFLSSFSSHSLTSFIHSFTLLPKSSLFSMQFLSPFHSSFLCLLSLTTLNPINIKKEVNDVSRE